MPAGTFTGISEYPSWGHTVVNGGVRAGWANADEAKRITVRHKRVWRNDQRLDIRRIGGRQHGSRQGTDRMPGIRTIKEQSTHKGVAVLPEFSRYMALLSCIIRIMSTNCTG